METWKEISGFEKYEASNEGEIRRTSTGRILKPYTNDRGYKVVQLYNKPKERKIVRIGKIVWESFNGCKCKKTIDHIDRNKLNDNLSNLRCVSNKDNANNRNIYEKKEKNKYNLDEAKKKEIITNLTRKVWTLTTVFKKYGIPTNYMSIVKKRGSWNYLLDERNGI